LPSGTRSAALRHAHGLLAAIHVVFALLAARGVRADAKHGVLLFIFSSA
jgi:hypothetical protein